MVQKSLLLVRVCSLHSHFSAGNRHKQRCGTSSNNVWRVWQVFMFKKERGCKCSRSETQTRHLLLNGSWWGGEGQNVASHLSNEQQKTVPQLWRSSPVRWSFPPGCTAPDQSCNVTWLMWNSMYTQDGRNLRRSTFDASFTAPQTPSGPLSSSAQGFSWFFCCSHLKTQLCCCCSGTVEESFTGSQNVRLSLEMWITAEDNLFKMSSCLIHLVQACFTKQVLHILVYLIDLSQLIPTVNVALWIEVG